MAKLTKNPYTWQSTSLGDMALGHIYDGVDNVYGYPARFRLIKHVNAVAVVSGHLAAFVSYTAMTVTNDVTGGGDGEGTAIVAGAYCLVAVQGNYCLVQVSGYHPTLLGDGSVAAGEGIGYEATDGTWDTLTTGQPNCGMCLLADTGSPATFPGFLNVPV